MAPKVAVLRIYNNKKSLLRGKEILPTLTSEEWAVNDVLSLYKEMKHSV